MKKKKSSRKKMLVARSISTRKERGEHPVRRRILHSPVASMQDIPHGYNVDTIVIMPINVTTSFLYWEITTHLLNGKGEKLNDGSAKLLIKIFETNRKEEIYSCEADSTIGKQYVSHASPRNQIVAEIGILKRNRFKRLLRSRPVTVPSYSSPTASGEVWMEKKSTSYKVIYSSDPRVREKAATTSLFIRGYVHDIMGSREHSLASWTHGHPLSSDPSNI